MSSEDTLALVEQAKAALPYGLQAFERLVRDQHDAVRHLALTIVRDANAADSICQDVMLRMMRGLPNLKDTGRFHAWLRRITVNASNTWLKKEIREREKVEQFATEADWEVRPEAHATVSFSDMVRHLNVEERTIVALKIVDDFEFQDIAEVVGIGTSAAKMRYYRALEKIKKRMSEDFSDA